MRREYYQKSNSKIKLKCLLSSLSIRPIRDSNISNWQREVCFFFYSRKNLQKENFRPRRACAHYILHQWRETLEEQRL